MKAIAGRWRFKAERWATLSIYQRFESALALALTIIRKMGPDPTNPLRG